MLTTPNEEITRIDKIAERTKNLRERQRNDFDILINADFEIPKEEGEWENYTSNSGSVLGNKILHMLSSADRRLYILKTSDEKKKVRAEMETAERFANGVIQQADYGVSVIPEQLFIQPAMAFQGGIRGIIPVRLILIEGEDGELIPTIDVWDAHNTFWISGTKGLAYCAYKRYDAAESIENDYNVTVEPDENGLVAVHDCWDTEEEGVFCLDAKAKKDKKPGSKWLLKQKHNLAHIPVGIFLVGNIPMIQDGKHTQADKYIGESIYVNNRKLYKTESRLRSYALTRAGQSAKMPNVIIWDSSKSGNKAPEIPSDPYIKGRIMLLDAGKGQDMKKFVELSSGESIRDILQQVERELNEGGMSPLENMSHQLTASGLMTLFKNNMERVFPIKRAMERAFEWMAREAVIQFKNGAWQDAHIEGFDDKSQYFRTDIKPEDVDDTGHFKCELSIECGQEVLEAQGIIESGLKTNVFSKRTAREHHPWIKDPDKEEEIINGERTDSIAGISLRRQAAALLEDGDIQGAMFVLQEIDKMQMQENGGGQTPGMPGVSPVGAMAGARASQPQNMAEQYRMKRLNLVRG
jgi:hypothetical protein